jgi:hypothetical protein
MTLLSPEITKMRPPLSVDVEHYKSALPYMNAMISGTFGPLSDKGRLKASNLNVGRWFTMGEYKDTDCRSSRFSTRHSMTLGIPYPLKPVVERLTPYSFVHYDNRHFGIVFAETFPRHMRENPEDPHGRYLMLVFSLDDLSPLEGSLLKVWERGAYEYHRGLENRAEKSLLSAANIEDVLLKAQKDQADEDRDRTAKETYPEYGDFS